MWLLNIYTLTFTSDTLDQVISILMAQTVFETAGLYYMYLR
jgi:hypothetical protein